MGFVRTRVGAQQDLRLPADPLSPEPGGVGAARQPLEVRVRLGPLGLTEPLLRELDRTNTETDSWTIT